MHRQLLLSQLERYRPSDHEEGEMRERIMQFVRQHEDCFSRSLLIGHITGSAFVVNPERTHILLTHHKKLNRWLQLGGHADGESNILNVAQREAEEESGLTDIHPVSGDIFDVDIHLIPARKTDPEHYHYDIRYLFEADSRNPVTVSDESHDLVWVPVKDVLTYTEERSMLRMVSKI